MRILARVVTVVGLLAADNAFACSCMQPTADDLLSSSVSIFTGVAVKNRTTKQNETITTFRVSTGYKGVTPGQVIRIRHFSGHSAACGVRFELGQQHSLTTYRKDGSTAEFTSLCSVAVLRSPGGEELLRRLKR